MATGNLKYTIRPIVLNFLKNREIRDRFYLANNVYSDFYLNNKTTKLNEYFLKNFIICVLYNFIFVSTNTVIWYSTSTFPP